MIITAMVVFGAIQGAWALTPNMVLPAFIGDIILCGILGRE